jgi:hypothetical protein
MNNLILIKKRIFKSDYFYNQTNVSNLLFSLGAILETVDLDEFLCADALFDQNLTDFDAVVAL